MNELFQIAAREIARFLESNLPKLDRDHWWHSRVIERLTFPQQRAAAEHQLATLRQLDLAALLRVFDQNWNDLSNVVRLPREGRSWIKELQTARNKWSHLSSEAMPPSETYRDADTLFRLLSAISSSTEALDKTEYAKAAALDAMAGQRPAAVPIGEKPSVGPDDEAPKASDATGRAPTLFKVGDLVSLRSEPTVHMPVLEVLASTGENRYRVFSADRTRATYYESQLQQVSDPGEVSAPVSVDALHARLTSIQVLSPSNSNLFSLNAGRVNFVPYQYRPVLKLLRSDRPRLLIADEVGVGKTIEAGLILKELRARSDLRSVLIICPKALVAERKWLVEMRRFDEEFTHLDGKLFQHCLNETHLEGEWPNQYANAILPFSLLDSDVLLGPDSTRSRSPGLLKLDPPPKFDLVIVDEAHHIRNSETFLHQGVRFFCDNADAVLLLTATPVQLGSEDLFTLLNVLRPD